MVTYLEKPITVKIYEWLERFENTISVGKRDRDSMEIFAYTDDVSDDKEITSYAKKNNIQRICNFSQEGVTDLENRRC